MSTWLILLPLALWLSHFALCPFYLPQTLPHFTRAPRPLHPSIIPNFLGPPPPPFLLTASSDTLASSLRLMPPLLALSALSYEAQAQIPGARPPGDKVARRRASVEQRDRVKDRRSTTSNTTPGLERPRNPPAGEMANRDQQREAENQQKPAENQQRLCDFVTL